VIPPDEALDTKSSNSCTTPRQQDTPAEMKPSPKSPTHTGGQGCVHGSQTTSRDAQYANKTKILLTGTHPIILHPTPENALPFQQIALDLITGLPPNGPHDSVLTIVDHRCSQVAVFLPCATTITALGLPSCISTTYTMVRTTIEGHL